MKVTNKQICKALMVEPLKANDRVVILPHNNAGVITKPRGANTTYEEYFSYMKGPINKFKDCKVCSIGAVLRHYTNLNERETISKFDDLTAYGVSCDSDSTPSNIRVDLENKKYWSALSGYFESTCEGERITKATRERLCRWVKANLPAKLDLGKVK